CTSRVRGSTSREYGLPLTLTLMRRRGISSGIEMRDLHRFTASATQRSFHGESRQRTGRLTFVFGRAPHVRLWLCDIHHGFANLRQALRCDRLPTQYLFRRTHSYSGQSQVAEHKPRLLAGLRVVHGELHRDDGAGIYRRAALKRKIGSAAAFRLQGYHNLSHDFCRLQRGGVSVLDEVRNVYAALTAG